MSSARRWALQDLWAGLLLAAFGIAALVFGADLAMGTARRMGPGYMPYGLAWLLVLCGAAVALRGVVGAGAAAADRTSRWGEVATLAAVSMALAAIVFVKLLGLNIPLWF